MMERHAQHPVDPGSHAMRVRVSSVLGRKSTPTHFRSALFVASAAWFFLLLLLPAAMAAAESVRDMPMTASHWGSDTASAEKVFAAQFVDSLNIRPGFNVIPAAAKGEDVLASPGSPGPWLSFVGVGLGEHRDFLALCVDESHTVIASFHRHARVGAGQYPDYAVRELAADLARSAPPDRVHREELRVQLVIRPWKDAAQDLNAGMDSPDAGKGVKAQSPLEPAGAESVDAARGLAIGSLGEAGFQATTQTAPTTLVIELAQAVDHFAFRLTLTRDGKSSVSISRGVPATDLYDGLLLAQRKIMVWKNDVRDAVRVGAGLIRPLAFGAGLLVLSDNSTLIALDPATGESRWKILPPPKTKVDFESWPGPGAESCVLRLGSVTDKIDIASVKVSALTTAGTGVPQAYCHGETSEFATVDASAVNLYGGGILAWSTKMPEAVTAGPAIVGRTVIVGTDAGELITLSANDGHELARMSTQLRLRGPISVVGDELFVGSMDGTFVAVSPKRTWRHNGGDVPLNPPQMVGGLLLVTTKANVIELLDPRTGEARACYACPTWLVGSAVVEKPGHQWVVCVDLAGTVRYLRLPDLKPVREIQLQARLTGPIVMAPSLPKAWAGRDEFQDPSAAVVVGDTEGRIYLIELPE